MSADLDVMPLPAGPVPPCSWWVDLPCSDDAVAMLESPRHRAGACARCMHLAVERSVMDSGGTGR